MTAAWILFFLLFLPSSSRALQVVTQPSSHQYHVEDSRGRVLFTGGDIAIFLNGKWCVHQQKRIGEDYQQLDEDEEEAVLEDNDDNDKDHRSLVPQVREAIQGTDPYLGPFVGEQVLWYCQIDDVVSNNEKVPIKTNYKNFNSSVAAVLFEVEWPLGASNTTVVGDYKSAMTNYPSLQVHLPNALSWHGSFTQSKRDLSEGTQGGPTVFYNGTDPTLETVIVGSPWRFIWKSFSAGNNRNCRGDGDDNDDDGSKTATTYWTPGTSGRIAQIPKGYRQSILLYQGKAGAGITGTINSWGQLMQSAGVGFPKLPDVTLEKIGYQTDNGAMYCFCKDSNCSQTLLQEVDSLLKLEIPMGYLSFQGSGASSGRGKAAPWCVETWGVDGGLNPNIYPMDLLSFQRALGLPLQLYAPYFCPSSSYFGGNSEWQSISSDSTLPHCKGYDFENVEPSQSREFYDWFMDKGIEKAGMISFESDFMNQNYNCVPEFIHSVSAAQVWQQGMAGAALAKNVTIQWCYASPTDIMASLDMPAVTNFRVSFDFCYGRSYDIGESSLLVWAMGVAPNKDTLWSTANNHTEIPGCPWTPDHEESAAELHVVLALMSNGPVGLSDAIGYTNATLLKRIMMKDGKLLKPTKPITAVDSTFLDVSHPILASGAQEGGYVYGTHGVGTSWNFVSFLLQEPYEVKLRDFWPPPQRDNNDNDRGYIFVYRSFGDGSECQQGQEAVESGCVKVATVSDNPSAHVFIAPEASSDPNTPGARFVPTVTTVWQPCKEGGWILLGELSKYVPISPVRFKEVVCHKGGIHVGTKGVPGEVVTLTALQPQGPMRYTVIQKKATMTDLVKGTFVTFGSTATGEIRQEQQ